MAYQVSEENLRKVESYIIKRCRETGADTIAEPVTQIAEGAGVALATAHNALKSLSKQRIISITKSTSKRNPNQYQYTGDAELFELEQEELSQIEYLQQLVQELTGKIEALQHENNELRGQLRIQAVVTH